mmetsp:Transcript_35170/g.75866  ORF Transcript_35170/g.75866 Transcript_35170/m.75866 type:complete len:282 (+) Transcript_35170:1420-2265(+)
MTSTPANSRCPQTRRWFLLVLALTMKTLPNPTRSPDLIIISSPARSLAIRTTLTKLTLLVSRRSRDCPTTLVHTATAIVIRTNNTANTDITKTASTTLSTTRSNSSKAACILLRGESKLPKLPRTGLMAAATTRTSTTTNALFRRSKRACDAPPLMATTAPGTGKTRRPLGQRSHEEARASLPSRQPWWMWTQMKGCQTTNSAPLRTPEEAVPLGPPRRRAEAAREGSGDGGEEEGIEGKNNESRGLPRARDQDRHHHLHPRPRRLGAPQVGAACTTVVLT